MQAGNRYSNCQLFLSFTNAFIVLPLKARHFPKYRHVSRMTVLNKLFAIPSLTPIAKLRVHACYQHASLKIVILTETVLVV
jgi:hypothetical protein